MEFVLLALGLALLVLGAELLIRSASALALGLELSPLVVGLTIVAYGTSAPEMIVSVQGAMLGRVDLALGNVVGSNIFNVGVILGLSALLLPLRVDQQFVRFELPLLLALSVLLFLLAGDGFVSRGESGLLGGGLIAYTVVAFVQGRREPPAVRDEYKTALGSASAGLTLGRSLWTGAGILAGLFLLVWGARWFTGASVGVARALGLSERVIGLTIVAAGTSLPELVTSLLAAARGERDIAVGNVIGSNIFNILGVLGLAGLVSAGGLPVARSLRHVDIPLMIGVTVACLPLFRTGWMIDRREGMALLAGYAIYTLYLIRF